METVQFEKEYIYNFFINTIKKMKNKKTINVEIEMWEREELIKYLKRELSYSFEKEWDKEIFKTMIIDKENHKIIKTEFINKEMHITRM